ncbi:MAG: hypothetical protein V3573_10790 [Desulfovibrionaceae bacterium]
MADAQDPKEKAMQSDAAKPAPKPAAKPAAKSPAKAPAKPAAAVAKPVAAAAKPAAKPGSKPTAKPAEKPSEKESAKPAPKPQAKTRAAGQTGPGVAPDVESRKEKTQENESGEFKTTEAVDAAKQYGQKALDATRDAAQNALQAASVVFTDPMGGQGKAMRSLGEKKAFAAGVVYVALYIVVNNLFSFGGTLGNQFGQLLFSLIMPAGLMACFWGLGRLDQNEVGLGGALFSAGVTLFPLTAATLLLRLGVFGGWLSLVVGLYGLTITILLIAGFLMDVLQASTRRAVVLTPTILTVLLLAHYLFVDIYWGWDRLFGNMFLR